MESTSDKEMGLGLIADRISDLPENVMDQILGRIPIRQAVRTSILSSKWRYKWTTIPVLRFNGQTDLGCIRGEKDLTCFIDRAFLLHSGLIKKFALSTTSCTPKSSIDCWILFLSRKNIDEFSLHYRACGRYKLPSCFFSFQQINSLELRGCELKPPSTFTCFSNLKNLLLREISISTSAYERLISKLPHLETLTMELFDYGRFDFGHLKICAPNLKYLRLFGHFKDICFENTPRLTDVSIGLTHKVSDQQFHHDLFKFFTALPKIRIFKAEALFLEFLSATDTPCKLPTTCQHLNSLFLELSVDDLNEIVTTLCLINSSPNLRELGIHARTKTGSGMDDFWKARNFISCNVSRLKVVNMCINNITLFPSVREFIKLLLVKSPLLEELTMGPSYDLHHELLEELRTFPRASSKAEIHFKDDCKSSRECSPYCWWDL